MVLKCRWRSCCCRLAALKSYFVAEMVMLMSTWEVKYSLNRLALCLLVGKLLFLFVDIYVQRPKITSDVNFAFH